MTTHCRVIAFLSAYTSRDLVTLWPLPLIFWPWTVVMHSGSRDKSATKSENPMTIRSWVTTYNGSLGLPLKMRTRPPRMRRITWPVGRGSKTITFLESTTPICLFTIQPLLGYDDDISSTSKVIANFLLKFGKFSLLWHRGSSEQSLTESIFSAH